jgi:hypothetical protein
MKITSCLITTLIALSLGSFRVAAQQADWQGIWKQTIDAAEREGHLTIAVASGEDWRQEVGRFQSHFPNIKLDISSLSGRDFWPRFIKEREAGQYLWDVRVGSIDNLEYSLKNAGNMQPIRGLLFLPEVLDDNSWHGGFDNLFLDKEKNTFSDLQQ